jgi:hypothetical protein
MEMLRDILTAAGGFEVLGCYDATDESLPAKPFRKRAGDVVLVLRKIDAKPARTRGGAGKRKTQKVKTRKATTR